MKKTSKEKSMKEEVIVLYPAPGIGHLISMVELAKHLLHHRPATAFSIEILLTTNSPDDTLATTTYIQTISQTNIAITFHHLPPLITPPTTSPQSSGAAVLFDFIRRNAPNVRHALQSISRTQSIRAFVIDLFCTSALSVAREIRIPVYYFFTSGAAILSCFLYFPTLDKQIGHNNNKSYKDLKTTFLEFPGLPLIPATHVPEPLLDRDDPAFADFINFCQNLPNSDGIIVNTFPDLEPISVSTLADSITPPIFYIGPLILSRIEKGPTFDDDKITQWLNCQPKQSVVFLCFGSRGSFSSTQLKEIAIGLENSDQRFLWVIKKDSTFDDDDLSLLLPEGFLNRTEARGMVVTSWVRQAEILSHESVGGFVTHCGWNSVLEAVVGGVPMVTWPLYAEQKLNKVVLVENVKIGIGLEMDKEDGFVSGSELEKKVRILMDFEGEIRVRCLKMKEMAMDAWTELGSSTTDLDQLVGLWKHNAQMQF